MCGRYAAFRPLSEVTDRFGIQGSLFPFEAHYNIAPQQDVAVVRAEMPLKIRILDGCRWGLVPSWARDTSMASRMINARAETLAEKPAFKRLLANRRCIIPADGFYEWDKRGGTRQPFYFRPRDGEMLGLAGLWDEWEAPDGSPLRTCTIITTAANDVVAPIHERMPVVLARGRDEDLWLDLGVRAAEKLTPLLTPYPSEELTSLAVSRRVNAPGDDDAALLEPLPL